MNSAKTHKSFLVLILLTFGIDYAVAHNKVVVVPLGDDAPLAIVTMSSIYSCTPPSLPSSVSGAIVTVQFSHDVEVVSSYPGGAAEALDDSLFFSSPDQNKNFIYNTLNIDASSSIQEKGVILDVTGDTMTIYWNPSVGLQIIDNGDPIISVTYSGLANVQVQRVGSPSSVRTLSSWLSSWIKCD